MSQEIESVTALTKQLTEDSISNWTEEKRQDFTKTFSDRVRVARYILYTTATFVSNLAKKKQFISDKHTNKLSNSYSSSSLYDKDTEWNNKKVGNRPTKDLDKIAAEKAEAIISKLPSLFESVNIISPEISKCIANRDKLLKEGKDLIEKSKEVSGSLDMNDLDQDMTIGDFKKLLKDRDKKRKVIVAKLDEIGTEGRELELKINKFLYSGLPGLSDAVIKVIQDYIDRATAFDSLNRRVEEQVKFGDSEIALEILKTFEQDESKVSSEIQIQFDNALALLKLSAKKKLPIKKTNKLLS